MVMIGIWEGYYLLYTKVYLEILETVAQSTYVLLFMTG